MTTAVRFTAGNRRVRLSQFKHEIERRGNPSPTVHFKTWHSGIARLGVLSKWRAFASGHVIGIYFVCEQDRASVPDERVGCILRSYGASNIGIRILAYPDAMPAILRDLTMMWGAAMTLYLDDRAKDTTLFTALSALNEAVCVYEARVVAGGNPRWGTVRRLDFEHCDITASAWDLLAVALGQMPLRDLIFGQITFPNADLLALCNGLAASRTVGLLVFKMCHFAAPAVAMVLRATGHLDGIEITVNQSCVTRDTAADVADAIRRRARPAGEIEMPYRSARTDADFARIMTAIAASGNARGMRIAGNPGPRTAEIIAAMAMRNEAAGLMYPPLCFLSPYIGILAPALMHSTSMSTRDWSFIDHKPHVATYVRLVSKGCEWRDFTCSMLTSPVDSSDSRLLIRRGQPNFGSADARCVTIHGMDAGELALHLARTCAPDVHSLAVGRTDMARGIPTCVMALPLRRLALMNCGITSAVDERLARRLRRGGNERI